jgi:hypothetical protein
LHGHNCKIAQGGRTGRQNHTYLGSHLEIICVGEGKEQKKRLFGDGVIWCCRVEGKKRRSFGFWLEKGKEAERDEGRGKWEEAVVVHSLTWRYPWVR